MARRWLRAPVLAVALLLMLAVPAFAAPGNTLSNGSVSPSSGSTATTFVFTVTYHSDAGAGATVTASVAGRTVQLGLASGSPDNGTYRGTATNLPAGSWAVSFSAVPERGNRANLPGPVITVTSSATPRPTPAPTSAPTPIPTPAPPPITATPLAPTPLGSAAPSLIGGESPGVGFIGGFLLTPAPSVTPDPAPAVETPGAGDEIWTLVTGGLIALSVLALLGIVGILRMRGRQELAAGQPIGPVQFRPPTEDE